MPGGSIAGRDVSDEGEIGMDTATTPRVIRNVALVGHSGSGKTTLAEGLLRRAGAIPRAGAVADGTTVCDFEPEEIKRGISLSLSLARLQWPGADGEACFVNLLDTPGYADFAGGVDAALAVADLAVVVVSAVDGVQAGTELLWQQCVAAGLPRLVFVSKEDKQHADFHAVLNQLRETFGAGLVPLELPIGEEEALRGLADLLSEQALAYDADGGHREEAVPAVLAQEEHRLHEEVAEEIVAGDDDQLERYLSGQVPRPAELGATLAREVCAGSVVPVLLGSATTGVGLDRLLDYLCQVAPSPGDRPARVLLDGAPTSVPADPAGEPLVQVFRTVADPFVGQLSLFKVLSGTVRGDDRLTNTATGAEERLHGLFHLRGKEHLAVDQVVAGDLAAVAKLTASPTGSLLTARPVDVRAPLPVRPTPYALALSPVSQSDDEKLSAALARLCAEDPCLRVEHVAGAGGPGQTVLRGLGDTHLEVALERLARKFGVHVSTQDVQVAYRETITGRAEAEGKVKKQSGGHGQYAVARLRVSPLPRGGGEQFVDSIVGGAIPRNYLPAVERGVLEAMAAGGVHGFPVVDVQVECFDGKYHPVDSSEMAFRTAAAAGLREALAQAGPVVLEPVSRVSVVVPDAYQGEVFSDLTTRRGRVTTATALPDGRQQVEALVPEAELRRYVLDLRSLTGGRGTFTAEHDHYEVLPAHLAEGLARPALAGAH